VKARQEAERVLAPSRAPRTFALAQEKESEAEAALGRQDAASARVQFQKEQARDRMTVARRTAEQAGPSQRGTSLLASAKAKEREAGAALARSDFGAAEKSFRAAESAYQAAAQEAKKEESEAQQQVAALTREEAVRIEANRLAKDVFDAAQAKQAEAEGLLSRRNYAAASLAFQDVTGRYMEATRRTQGRRGDKSQAESARTRMLAEKQQANPAASDFASGLAEERQGNGLYDRLAYREATERFKSAEAFFDRRAPRRSRRHRRSPNRNLFDRRQSGRCPPHPSSEDRAVGIVRRVTSVFLPG